MSYRSYWTRVVLQALEVQRGNLSVKEISELTAIRPDDIVKTLESLNLIKYWKVRSATLPSGARAVGLRRHAPAPSPRPATDCIAVSLEAAAARLCWSRLGHLPWVL